LFSDKKQDTHRQGDGAWRAEAARLEDPHAFPEQDVLLAEQRHGAERSHKVVVVDVRRNAVILSNMH
jgi:hypothetical protein